MTTSARFLRFTQNDSVNPNSVDLNDHGSTSYYADSRSAPCTTQVLGIPYSDDMIAHLVGRFTSDIPDLVRRLNSKTGKDHERYQAQEQNLEPSTVSGTNSKKASISNSISDPYAAPWESADPLIYHIAGITGVSLKDVIHSDESLIGILKREILNYSSNTSNETSAKRQFLNRYSSVYKFGGGELMSRLYDMVNGDEGLFSLAIELLSSHAIATCLTLPGFDKNLPGDASTLTESYSSLKEAQVSKPENGSKIATVLHTDSKLTPSSHVLPKSEYSNSSILSKHNPSSEKLDGRQKPSATDSGTYRKLIENDPISGSTEESKPKSLVNGELPNQDISSKSKYNPDSTVSAQQEVNSPASQTAVPKQEMKDEQKGTLGSNSLNSQSFENIMADLKKDIDLIRRSENKKRRNPSSSSLHFESDTGTPRAPESAAPLENTSTGTQTEVASPQAQPGQLELESKVTQHASPGSNIDKAVPVDMLSEKKVAAQNEPEEQANTIDKQEEVAAKSIGQNSLKDNGLLKLTTELSDAATEMLRTRKALSFTDALRIEDKVLDKSQDANTESIAELASQILASYDQSGIRRDSIQPQNNTDLVISSSALSRIADHFKTVLAVAKLYSNASVEPDFSADSEASTKIQNTIGSRVALTMEDSNLREAEFENWFTNQNEKLKAQAETAKTIKLAEESMNKQTVTKDTGAYTATEPEKPAKRTHGSGAFAEKLRKKREERAAERARREAKEASTKPAPTPTKQAEEISRDMSSADNDDTFYLVNDDDYTKYVYDEFDEDEDFLALSDQIAELFPTYSRSDLKVRLKVSEDISELIEALFLEQETKDILEKVTEENRELDYEADRRHFSPDVHQLKEIFPTHDLDALERLLQQYNGDLELVTNNLLSGTISATYERVGPKEMRNSANADTSLWGSLPQASKKLAQICGISTIEATGFLTANHGKFIESMIEVIYSRRSATVVAAPTPTPEPIRAVPRGGRVQRGGANLRVVKTVKKVVNTGSPPPSYKFSPTSKEAREMFSIYDSNPQLGSVHRKFLEKAIEFFNGDVIRVIDVCRLIVEHDSGFLTRRKGLVSSGQKSDESPGASGISYATAVANASSRSSAFSTITMGPQFAKWRSKVDAAQPIARDLQSPRYQQFKRSGELDLHHLKLTSALQVTKLALKEWWAREVQHREHEGNLSKYGARAQFVPGLSLITGRGLHSIGGVPVIKMAVGRYLKANGYLYDEGVGQFLVTGYRK